MKGLMLRAALPADRPKLRQAVVELQEYERRLHETRRSGEEVADDYLNWMLDEAAANGGTIIVAESDGEFVGFAAGWIVHDDNIAETVDSNRFGCVSDVCVLPSHRGRQIATRLLAALEQHFRQAGVKRMRITALAANTSARASYERAGFVAYEIVHEKVLVAPDRKDA